MNRASLRPALLAVAVLLAARPAWAAVPLKELTQEKLRDWASAAVKASRDDPDRAEFWKALDARIVVAADRIVYERDKGVPVRLVWECKPRRELDVEERTQAKKDLQRIFGRAIREHDGGLLSEDDARLLAIVSRFEVGPYPRRRSSWRFRRNASGCAANWRRRGRRWSGCAAQRSRAITLWWCSRRR